MAQSNSRILIHTVFGTKGRQPILQPEICEPLYEYMGGVLLKLGNKPIQIGGHRDHVHALFDLGRENSVAKTVSELKTSSTKYLKKQGIDEAGWQLGYGAFSVSGDHLPAVAAYIRSQEEHHKVVSFRDELMKLFEDHGISWDERDF